MNNLGKQWEQRFKQDWLKTFPNSFIFRLNDQTSGFKNLSANPCDFICYNEPKLFLIECKEHKGASLPFNNIHQYDKLLQYINISGVYPSIILWLSEKDKVLYIPITTIQRMKSDGEKSIGLRNMNKYNILEIPSEKKRVFMESDYSILMTTEEGE